MRCVRVIVHGRVQGVWFRGWTRQKAHGLGLNGWVRNLQDGSVEALFQGPESSVASMIDACRRGPPAARVTKLEEFPSCEEPGPGFHQHPGD